MPTPSPVFADPVPTSVESIASVRASLGSAWRHADRWARAHPREALLFGVAGGVGVGLVGIGVIVEAATRNQPFLATLFRWRAPSFPQE